jgi:heptosyltransferase-2
VEEYDILISLDKEIPSTALATKIKSRQKFGFGINPHGHLTIFNKASHYAYRLGIDDRLKFHENKKTYQEVIYEACELDYQKDRYVFELREEDRKTAETFFKKNKLAKNSPWIGINTGAGSRFETKRWPRKNFLQLIRLLTEKQEAAVFLLGGEKEEKVNYWLQKKAHSKIHNTGSRNTLRDFAGFLSFLDVVVSSDSLAMHLALALGKKVVVLFGSTAPQEIELYGLGKKIFAGVDCAPCYKESCPDMKCMKAIIAEEVYKEIKTLL